MSIDIDREFEELAASLEAELGAVEVPAARRERAMFVEGVAQRPRHRFRVLVPALATMALVAVFLLGRSAQPNQVLYPVREALSAVGLATPTVDDVDRLIDEARETIQEAEFFAGADDRRASKLVADALTELGRAEVLLTGLSDKDRDSRAALIDRLQERALQVILVVRGLDDDNSGPGNDEGSSSGSNSGSGSDDGDNSGPGSDGSGSDDGGGDNSGPGSGGDDAIDSGSSGPGSGDDSIDSDNSGPGGGGGDDSLDSSGSGSRDSGTDDSSGSGSGTSGSGSGSGSSVSGSGSSGSGSDDPDHD
jgi:hypothetical protein